MECSATKILEPRLHAFGQSIVSGTHIREFGLAADRGDRTAVEQGGARRDGPERAVGMPELVAELEAARLVIGSPDPAFEVEDSRHRQYRGRGAASCRPAQSPLRNPHGAEAAREGQMLLAAQLLVREDEHGIAMKGLVDRGPAARIERLERSMPPKFGGEILVVAGAGSRTGIGLSSSPGPARLRCTASPPPAHRTPTAVRQGYMPRREFERAAMAMASAEAAPGERGLRWCPRPGTSNQHTLADNRF